MKLKGLGVSVLVCVVGCAGSRPVPVAAPDGASSNAETTAAAPEREAVAQALELYAAENYEAAASAFARAYADDPDTSLLFAQAQSLRLAGQCDQAWVLYDQYLAMATDPTDRNAIESLVDGCTPPAELTPDSLDTQVAAR